MGYLQQQADVCSAKMDSLTVFNNCVMDSACFYIDGSQNYVTFNDCTGSVFVISGYAGGSGQAQYVQIYNCNWTAYNINDSGTMYYDIANCTFDAWGGNGSILAGGYNQVYSRAVNCSFRWAWNATSAKIDWPNVDNCTFYWGGAQSYFRVSNCTFYRRPQGYLYKLAYCHYE